MGHREYRSGPNSTSEYNSDRMMIHVRQGKGGRDRDVLLSPKLLQTLREYWRWMKPKTFLFPGMVNNWRADVPINRKVVWCAVREAAERAGIQKRVSPHTQALSQHTCWKRAPRSWPCPNCGAPMVVRERLTPGDIRFQPGRNIYADTS